MPTEISRITSGRKVTNPANSSQSFQLTVIDSITFVDEQGQETVHVYNNKLSPPTLRKVQDITVNGSDGTSTVQFESIQQWFSIDNASSAQETDWTLTNDATSGSPVPAHAKTHTFDITDSSVPGGYLRMQRIDQLDTNEPSNLVDEGSGDYVYQLYWPDDDMSNPATLYTADDGSAINPPWRVDPWQFPVDVKWGTEYLEVVLYVQDLFNEGNPNFTAFDAASTSQNFLYSQSTGGTPFYQQPQPSVDEGGRSSSDYNSAFGIYPDNQPPLSRWWQPRDDGYFVAATPSISYGSSTILSGSAATFNFSAYQPPAGGAFTVTNGTTTHINAANFGGIIDTYFPRYFNILNDGVDADWAAASSAVTAAATSPDPAGPLRNIFNRAYAILIPLDSLSFTPTNFVVVTSGMPIDSGSGDESFGELGAYVIPSDNYVIDSNDSNNPIKLSTGGNPTRLASQTYSGVTNSQSFTISVSLASGGGFIINITSP